MKKINLFMVAALLVALVVPAGQAHAGSIIGIQGGYALQKFSSRTMKSEASGASSTTKFKRSDLTASALESVDNQGGFVEFNYDYTIGFGKMVYLGFGPYFQWAGTKDLDKDTDDKLTHVIAVGPEVVVGFNVIPLLDVTLRAGVGFAYAKNSESTHTFNDPYMGVNWRVIPGVTFKFGKIGVFVEAGYVGNWLVRNYEQTMLGINVSIKDSFVYHGAQVGFGVKLYL